MILHDNAMRFHLLVFFPVEALFSLSVGFRYHGDMDLHSTSSLDVCNKPNLEQATLALAFPAWLNVGDVTSVTVERLKQPFAATPSTSINSKPYAIDQLSDTMMSSALFRSSIATEDTTIVSQVVEIPNNLSGRDLPGIEAVTWQLAKSFPLKLHLDALRTKNTKWELEESEELS